MDSFKTFDTVEGLMAEFDALSKKEDRYIVLLSGSTDASTGMSWCDDCDAAKPAIEKLMQENGGKYPAIKGTVERADWRGVATHPYKVHPLLKAAGVPTLLLFAGTEELLRADDLEHFGNEDMMAMFNEDA